MLPVQFFGTRHVFLKNVEEYPFHKVSIHLHKHYKQIIELFFFFFDVVKNLITNYTINT